MRLRQSSWILAIALIARAGGLQAQDQKPAGQSAAQPSGSSAPILPMNSGLGPGYAKPPIPAARGVSSDYDSNAFDPSDVTPDQNTLAGAQTFGMGSLAHVHNIFDPSISVSQLGLLSPPAAPGQSNFTGSTLVGGIMNFSRNWGQYHFTAAYNGGETFTEGIGSAQSFFHDLILSQEIDWGRWHVILRDDFVASPGAAFTNTGMGGPGLSAQFFTTLGSSLTSIGQSFVPGETIQTGIATRFRNASLGQASYSFSRRAAFTVSGSYGFLTFPEAGYFSSRMYNAQAGYDYLLDPSNSVAILGSYGKIDYTGTSISTTSYAAALAYGRKITGRMAFQVEAGPEQIRSINAAGPYQLWFLSANSNLGYEWRRGGVTLSFARGLNSGSGVFLGETGNTFTGSGHYEFSRAWTGTVNSGYGISTSLAPAGVATTRFDNWYIGANLGRRLGPHIQFNFNYGLEEQIGNAVCPVTSCGVNGFQQTFGMTVNWHLRPAG
jgi:hypothetical protein